MSHRTSRPEADATTKPHAISFAEVVLVCGYFLAVWIIPIEWIDTAAGAIAIAIASKINPYLWEYSISFAKRPEWFIHCHVIATIIGSWIFPLMVRAQGGFASYQKVVALGAQQCGGVALYWIRSGALIFVLYVAMFFSVDPYLSSRAQNLIWGDGIGVCVSALLYAAGLSIGVGISYVCIRVACAENNGESS